MRLVLTAAVSALPVPKTLFCETDPESTRPSALENPPCEQIAVVFRSPSREIDLVGAARHGGVSTSRLRRS